MVHFPLPSPEVPPSLPLQGAATASAEAESAACGRANVSPEALLKASCGARLGCAASASRFTAIELELTSKIPYNIFMVSPAFWYKYVDMGFFRRKWAVLHTNKVTYKTYQ